ncbi:unnamed protein product [Rotaria magnacalcarata]|uniref:Uncharacterized protein n=1 Tax=Rotaria magnacalcarata TaxID=392030 RepID=A0A816SJJ8_9BILA|nr:unnamed protein product [Rotaria magnacalcarata]
MSAPSKSIDKNKRYAGVKANDFVNKARTNETSRAAARTQGWTNLGKISSRRIPPPANLPSLKSETGTATVSFDPTISTGTSHGWTASGNQTPTNLAANQTRPLTPSKQPTQQQLDSLSAHVSTSPPPSSSSTLTSDIDKPRGAATWSTVTAGNTTGNSNDHPPNLLGLNDFPRLATQDNKTTKSQPDSLLNSISTMSQGPIFRPANLASWKEGGGRAQPMSNDLTKESNDNNNNNLSALSMQSQMIPTNASSNLLQSQIQNSNNSQYNRMYQPQQQQQQQQQMWSYNVGNSYGSYGANQAPSSMSMHQLHHHQQRASPYGNNAQSQSQQQRMNASADYKTPTILRNKDIDDLSKLTDNVTWASAPQEVNYEEKIRFSDDEDNDITDNNTKSRRYNNNNNNNSQKQSYPQVLQNNNNNNNRSMHTNYSQQQTTRSRLLQDDEHVKQMQDDKNSELINTLTVAKQRRDEQERNLRDSSQRPSTTVQKSFDDQKQIPGYQTRPLITSTGKDNLSSSQIDSSSLWGQSNSGTASRTRHDTADSQTFAMKSWSDQMDSFNYASLHEKSGGQVDTDDHHDDTTAAVTITSVPSATHKYSRSQSESSCQSQTDNNGTTINRSKNYPMSNRRQPKSNLILSKPTRPKAKPTDVIDYFENNEHQHHMKSNDQWGDIEKTNYNSNNRYQQSYSNDRRSTTHHQQQQNFSEDLSQKSNRHNEQTNDYNRTKQPAKTRSNVASRQSDMPSSSSSKVETKTVTNKTQPAWRPLSPARPLDPNEPTLQEAITYKSQIKTNDSNDRRQSAPVERKQHYTTSTTPINTASIPPLMSVRSDVPLTPIQTSNTASKHFKTSNQSQRQDYNSSSHYSQRNDFYSETNDSAWGNDEDYYDDETGYYDPNIQNQQRHHQSMGYHSNVHHRGYIALGSYGRYRRGGTLRQQQQYNAYGVSTTSSQHNTSTGARTKKVITNRTTTTKKLNESPEQTESTKLVSDEIVKKPTAWGLDKKPSITEEVPKVKPIETPVVPIEIEKPKETITITSEPKPENEPIIAGQTEIDSTLTNKKPTATTNSQRKPNKDQQNYHYQNQPVSHHRNTYGRSAQDYDTTQISSHNYYATGHRTTRGSRTARMHDLSGGYYYEHPQQRYNNRYNYSNEHYAQQHQVHVPNKTIKRAGSSTATNDRQQTKQQTMKGSNAIINPRLQSASDNEQKEGEEWETASESSANMRSAGHPEVNPQVAKSITSETKSTHRDRTPPKKSFSSQRPLNSRHTETGIHRRSHNLHDRGSKTTRITTHRSSRSVTNQKSSSIQRLDEENSTGKQVKKDQHRHSLDGYDLNNVAGVVKIETLPASALEEENEAFDDGGEEFCVVMSKRGRKEQKAAQLSKQIAIESTVITSIPTDQPIKPALIANDEKQTIEKISNDTNQTSAAHARNGKSVPPRFNSKTSSSTTRQHNTKTDHQSASMNYYYDQNYYYYDQSQYYDDGSYYSYGNYNQSHRQPPTRRKQRSQQSHDANVVDDIGSERKPEVNIAEKVHSTASNVMSNIQMWDPHTDSTISISSKLIEKRTFLLSTHDRKFGNEVVPSSSSNDPSLPLHQRTATDLTTHSTVSKTSETIARTIKPPVTDNKVNRDNKTKSTSYEKNDTIASLGSNQLFEKSTFLDYDDKQSIGTVGDDYNQKINSLKTIWDASDHPSMQLEQTINTMVAMKQKKQHHDNTVPSNSSTKTDTYVKESIPTSSTSISVTNTNVSSTIADDTNNKNTVAAGNLQSTGSSSTINQPPTYSTSTVSSKNEQKNICTVKPTQQVAPNIQDQVDVTSYQTFAAPPLPPPMSQASLQQQQQQQQQHILPQSQVNTLHQQHTYPFYENLLPAPPPPLPQQQAQQQQQQQQFNRYAPQNFQYRNTNVFIQPPNVPNTNSMFHHTSQGSISAPPQNNAMPPMATYPSPFLVDHGGHMISQPQPPPPQAYINNQMMSGRPQGGPYYRTTPQQQMQTPPGPPYGSQDPLAHGGFYPSFFQPPNSNAPPVGHPSAHNLYGQNEGFHPPHPQMFARAGSIDRGDHPLMSQPPPQSLSRPTNYPSTSSNQQQQGQPPSLLSQNLKSFHTNQQQTSSSNQAQFYPPLNQYARQLMPSGAMNTTNNRPQTQPVPSLMSGLNKNFSNNGNNMNNTQSSFQHRQPLLPPQSNNSRLSYQHNAQYPNYSKSAGPNDDNVKPKHM